MKDFISIKQKQESNIEELDTTVFTKYILYIHEKFENKYTGNSAFGEWNLVFLHTEIVLSGNISIFSSSRKKQILEKLS